MSVETRDTLLYGQLQEGLKYTLMKSQEPGTTMNCVKQHVVKNGG